MARSSPTSANASDSGVRLASRELDTGRIILYIQFVLKETTWRNLRESRSSTFFTGERWGRGGGSTGRWRRSTRCSTCRPRRCRRRRLPRRLAWLGPMSVLRSGNSKPGGSCGCRARAVPGRSGSEGTGSGLHARAAGGDGRLLRSGDGTARPDEASTHWNGAEIVAHGGEGAEKGGVAPLFCPACSVRTERSVSGGQR